jgi:pyruvate kinase
VDSGRPVRDAARRALRRENALSDARDERRTKIVATIGPASRPRETLARLIDEGLDVARLNASHSSHAERREVVAALRAIETRRKKPIGILLDLQGPKIRVGALEGGAVDLVEGRRVVIEPGDFVGSAARLPTNYRALPRDVSRGDAILLDDGKLRLRVTRVRAGAVDAEVVVGGHLRDRKGINLPGTRVSAPSLTAKDRADLAHGLAAGADYVALSFVRSAGDLRALRRAVGRRRGVRVGIIAKIEKPEAVERIDEIIRECDGIMVARGDLGVEVAPEKVPAIQKALIQKANGTERLVITATQMLESMMTSPVPTRAEASDVANAIFDGTDAVMLSGETAAGSYPVEAVKMMASIAREAESHGEFASDGAAPADCGAGGDLGSEFAHAMARAACFAAREAGIDTILVLTLTGRTALTISKMKPPARIIAGAASLEIAGRMALFRGVVPMVMPLVRTTDRLIANADRALLRSGLAARGDAVILLSGRTRSTGATNMIKLHRIGEE